MGNRRGGSKSAECGACVTALHASTCLRRGTEEAQEAGTSSTMFQALKVPGPHIHSVLQPPSTRHYSLPLLQPGTRPAEISAKRQWSLPIQTTACQAIGFSALHPSELLTTSSVSGTACRAKPACRLLGHPLLLGCPVVPTSGAHSSSGPGENMGQGGKAEGAAFSFQKHRCVCSC